MTEEALRELIDIAVTDGRTELDLFGEDLTSLPPEIGQLQNLTTFSVHSNQLTSLPPEIGQLQNLKKLTLDSNQLTCLPPEIGQLQNLKKLYVRRNQLTKLPPEIGQLQKLTELYVRHNLLPRLPLEISQLNNLTKLNVAANLLTSLPPEIGQLENLTTLSVYLNQLTELPPEIGRLRKLTTLSAFSNELVSLPSEIICLKELKFLDFRGNEQLNFPPEVLQKIRFPREIIEYCSQITEEAQPMNECKVLVVGQAKVGKTSLIKRLLHDEFDHNEDQTHGLEQHQWPLPFEGDTIRLNVWDFGGQDIYHATHQFFLTKRSIYLLVLDSRLDAEGNQIHRWLRVIQNFGGDSPIIVVCNQCDQQKMELDWAGLQKDYPQIQGFARTVSCSENVGIAEVKELIQKQIPTLKHVRDPFPKKWFAVKEYLETMDNNVLDYALYEQKCEENDVTDEREQERLIDFMHDLGIVLHYQDHPILEQANILNPRWVTDGVYRIMDHRDFVRQRGIIDLQAALEVLPSEDFPIKKHARFIFEMMKLFELCFDFPQSDGERFLVPELLPKESPDTGRWDDALRFQFRYDVLPGSVISRFLVRMHDYVSADTAWRTGAVLKSDREDNRALVKANLTDRIISIAIDGRGDSRRRFLDVIRACFLGIHKTLPRAGAKEWVPVPEHPDCVVSYELLCRLEERGRTEHDVEYREDLLTISVPELLNGVSSPEDRVEHSQARQTLDRHDEGSKYSLPPSRERAYLWYRQAMEQEPNIETDAEAHDFIVKALESRGKADQLPSLDTFCRYLREARKYYGTSKNTARRGRTGRSIVHFDEIEHPEED